MNHTIGRNEDICACRRYDAAICNSLGCATAADERDALNEVSAACSAALVYQDDPELRAAENEAMQAALDEWPLVEGTWA